MEKDLRVESEEHIQFLNGLIFERYTFDTRARMRSFYNTWRMKHKLPKPEMPGSTSLKYQLTDDSGKSYIVGISPAGVNIYQCQ